MGKILNYLAALHRFLQNDSFCTVIILAGVGYLANTVARTAAIIGALLLATPTSSPQTDDPVAEALEGCLKAVEGAIQTEHESVLNR